jgi:hypothetical protein
VVVDARHAAATALGKSPELRLSSCSRWPERAGCGQECLRQIEASPGEEIDWAGRKPALLGADGVSVEWNEVPAEKLQETLAAASPVCFACHMANTLVRQHPELAVDRARPKA